MADPTGIVARTVAALRYAVTGQQPAEWFGPGRALPDQAPPEVKGRGFDYPYSVNLNYIPRSGERVNFKTLKLLATNCEPLKIVMARQRDLVKAREWTVKARVEKKGAESDPSITAIIAQLERPDRTHDWPQWINGLLDQVFVYDALSIYPRMTRGGDVYALELIDGATITPLVDQWGRPPMAPDPCYKQIIKGLPAVSYSQDELIYYPENYRVDHIYGFSRVEQVKLVVDTAIAQLNSQLAYFTHGNVGDGYFTAPVEFNPDQVGLIEKAWNAYMSPEGGKRLADRRQSPWLPGGVEWHPTKIDLFESGFEEWLLRLICFPFGCPVTAFVKETGMGAGSGTMQHQAAEEAGLAQLSIFVQRLMTSILATKFKRPDLEFAWIEDDELDPEKRSIIEDRRLKNGTLTIDEVRDRNGDAPYPNGIGARPTLASGVTRLEDAVADPEPVPAPLASGVAALPTPNSSAPANDDEAATDSNAALAKAAAKVREIRLQQIVARYLAAKGNELAQRIPTALGLAKADPSSEDYGNRVQQAFDDIDWNWSDFTGAVESTIVGIAAAAGRDAVSELGLFDPKVLEKVAERATAWAHDRAAELVGMKWIDGELVANPDAAWSISETTRTQLRTLVEDAMRAGQSNAELSQAIRGATAFDRDRANMIARTETATADVQGAVAGWRAIDVVAGKQWLTAPDCCDECLAYDGQIVALDDEFPEGDAPLHPFCRCTILPVLPEDMPDAT